MAYLLEKKLCLYLILQLLKKPTFKLCHGRYLACIRHWDFDTITESLIDQLADILLAAAPEIGSVTEVVIRIIVHHIETQMVFPCANFSRSIMAATKELRTWCPIFRVTTSGSMLTRADLTVLLDSTVALHAIFVFVICRWRIAVCTCANSKCSGNFGCKDGFFLLQIHLLCVHYNKEGKLFSLLRKGRS